MVRKSQGVIREGHFCFGSLRPRGGRLGGGFQDWMEGRHPFWSDVDGWSKEEVLYIINVTRRIRR